MFDFSRARAKSLAALTLAAATSGFGLVALATPASAGFVTFCEGSGGAVTANGSAYSSRSAGICRGRPSGRRSSAS